MPSSQESNRPLVGHLLENEMEFVIIGVTALVYIAAYKWLIGQAEKSPIEDAQ